RLHRRYAGHRGELGDIVVDGGAVLGDVGEHSGGVVAATGGGFLGEERVAAFRTGGVVAGGGRAAGDGGDKGDGARKEHSSPTAIAGSGNSGEHGGLPLVQGRAPRRCGPIAGGGPSSAGGVSDRHAPVRGAGVDHVGAVRIGADVRVDAAAR